MTRVFTRAALVATAALGVGGLVAVPADAAVGNYVTQPAVSGASSITPESAVLSGAIDTGGDPGLSFTGTPASPYSFGGLPPITTAGILNGIPVGLGFYSTATFVADPLSDYTASGDQFGADAIRAPAVEVPTATGLSGVSAEIGTYPDPDGLSDDLTPGTKYVYELVQQAGETSQATQVNEFSETDLANWIAGSGTITANGFSSPTTVTSSNDYAAWLAGTGSYAGDPADSTKVPASVVNPDYACVLDTTVAANTDAGWAAQVAAKVDPATPGTASAGGVALPDGIASAASGVFTAAAASKPAELGSCFTFYGGNSTNYYDSPVGYFTTPKLGTIVISPKATVTGKKVTITIKDASVEDGAGTIALATKKFAVASGTFSVPAKATQSFTFTLSKKAVAALKKSKGKLVATVTATSTTDQPVSGTKVTLKLS